MIDDEDGRPRNRAGFTPAALDSLSIEDLDEYIGVLEAEIARVRRDIERKKAARSGADAFFKSA